MEVHNKIYGIVFFNYNHFNILLENVNSNTMQNCVMSLTASHAFQLLLVSLLLPELLPLEAAFQEHLTALLAPPPPHTIGSLLTCALHGEQCEAVLTATLQLVISVLVDCGERGRAL